MTRKILMLLLVVSFLLPFYYYPVDAMGGEAPVNADIPDLPKYKVHIVKPGENLHSLSALYYNNARLWEEIYKANRDSVKNPDIIHPGQRLFIPETPIQ